MTELATVPANNNGSSSPLGKQARKSLSSMFRSSSSPVGENGKKVDHPAHSGENVPERQGVTSYDEDVEKDSTAKALAVGAAGPESPRHEVDETDEEVVNELTDAKKLIPAPIVGVGSTDATIATATVGNASLLSPADRPTAAQESIEGADTSVDQSKGFGESNRSFSLQDVSKQPAAHAGGGAAGDQDAKIGPLVRSRSARARPDPRADEADLSQLRGMGMRIAEEDKIRSVNKEEDSEDLSALAEIVPGLLTNHQAVRRMSWAETGNEPRSPSEFTEDVWRVREGKNAKSSPGKEVVDKEVEGTGAQVAEKMSSPTKSNPAAIDGADAGDSNAIPEDRAVGGVADVGAKVENSSDSTSEADAKLSDLKEEDEGQAKLVPEMNGLGTDTKEGIKESALSSSISSKKTYSSGNAKDLSSLPSDSGGGVNYDEFAQEAAAVKPSKDQDEYNTRKGRQKKEKSERSASPYEGTGGDDTTGSAGRAMLSSSRSLKQSQRSIGSEPDEVPAPPPSAQTSSGIPQTMPMYLPTFKPATGCTNASDFIVRCFVARLRSGITVVKHGRSRWCKSRLRILHIHPDGRSLSWKPALGEPTSSKRPPKLDLSTCLEVRHAWSPDPLHPIFTGTPILRQKCEAANAHKSFALIFPRRTVDVTAVTADQCKVLMEGFSALCFRLQVANLAGKKKDGLDEKGLDKEGSDKGKSSEGRTSSETSSPTNNSGMVRRSRFQ